MIHNTWHLPETLHAYQSGRTSTHIETFLPIWSRGSVAHCFNLLHHVWYRTTKRTAPNRWQRFESSCNQSVFNFFSLLGSHVLVVFFHLLIFFILHVLLHFEIHLMSLLHYFCWKWSRNNSITKKTFQATFFYWKCSRNNSRIKEFFKQNPNQWEEEEV